MLEEDLAQLRKEYPDWRFGTVWASASPDPNARRLWARREDVLLSGWSATEIRAAIKVEERCTWAEDPDISPPVSGRQDADPASP